MSTISESKDRGPIPPPEDPFRYGWRFVRVARPDGTEELDQIPLTLEDVLHPEEGDFIVTSDAHSSDIAYLRGVFKFRLVGDRTAVVLSKCRVDWNIPGVRPLGPDIAVFIGARRRLTWSTFYVAEEHVRPALVIEITSPDTRVNDIGIKVDYYRRAGVPQYVIADATEEGERRRIELIDHRWDPAGHHRPGLGVQGRVWLAPVRLWLGQTRDRLGDFMRLACFDPDTDLEVGDYTAVSQALADSQILARAEARAATQSRRARTQARRARAEARARAEVEARARAEAEARVVKAEARIRDLEEELRRRIGPNPTNG